MVWVKDAMKKKLGLYIVLIVASLLVLLSTLGTVVLAETPQPETATESETPTGDTPTGDAPAPTATALLEGVVETRTPEPTATPGLLEEEVERLARATGLYRRSFLGLSGTDWINLGISMLVVLVGYALGTLLIRGPLPKVVRRTPTTFDDKLLQAIGPDLRWLVVILVLNFATKRLTFLSAEVKTFLGDVYFVLGMIVGFRALWRLIDLAEAWYRERLAEEDRLEQLDPVLVLLNRMARIVVVLIGLIILLSHFGVNVSGLGAVLGLSGLAFSLAARDTVADAIAGFIILIDQPFRIGDRIEIQEVGTWGDVIDIGLRTTRIRTRDNRMVIVPNSTIGKNQVINYTFPDPRYRIQTHVGIGYGTDIEMARSLIVDTVQQVEGVLLDKPVDALYVEMGDSAMIFRVRWWIESYADTRRMFDRVHTALQVRLDEAGIECPFPTQTLNLQVEQPALERISQTLRVQNPEPTET
jgi:MscS family membrane protein